MEPQPLRLAHRPAPVRRPPAPARPPAEQLARLAGNALFARAVAPGSGILPGGTVAPAVDAAIRARSGRGAALDARMGGWASERLGLPVSSVRVHDDPAAHALARAVSARAFTVKQDVFFGAGEYRPQTADGQRLIRHELTHAADQQGAALSGPLKVTEPGDAHERRADAVADGG